MKEVKAHALAQYDHCLCYADAGQWHIIFLSMLLKRYQGRYASL